MKAASTLALLLNSEYVSVPGSQNSKKMLKKCVHEVPNGARIQIKQNETIVLLNNIEIARHHTAGCASTFDTAAAVDTAAAAAATDKADPSHPFEWKAWTELHANSEIVQKTGQWTVPSTPVQTDIHNLFYFGQGLMPDDNSIILQNMLQWGYGAPSGGRQNWAMASWIVGESTGYFTKLLEVQEGETVRGEMTLLKNGSWFVNSITSTDSANFTIDASETGALTWAYNVAEAYNFAACHQYPAGTLDFFNLTLEEKVAPVSAQQWKPSREMQYPLLCQEHATTTSFADTTIHWKQSTESTERK